MHTLHYKVFGTTGPVVVLLHGFLTSHEYWQGSIIEELSRTHRLVAVDLLGFGSSPMPQDSLYDADAHVAALHYTLERVMRGEESFILVGHSMGGVIAALYAKAYPAHIKKIIAITPPMFKNAVEARKSIQSTSLLYRLFLYSKLRMLAPFFLRLAVKVVSITPKDNARNIYVLEKGFRKSTHHSRRRSLGAIIEDQSFLEIITRVSPPVKVLVGKRDRQEYMKNLQQAQLPPHITVKVIDSGHHIPKKHPDIVIAEIAKL